MMPAAVITPGRRSCKDLCILISINLHFSERVSTLLCTLPVRTTFCCLSGLLVGVLAPMTIKINLTNPISKYTYSSCRDHSQMFTEDPQTDATGFAAVIADYQVEISKRLMNMYSQNTQTAYTVTIYSDCVSALTGIKTCTV